MGAARWSHPHVGSTQPTQDEVLETRRVYVRSSRSAAVWWVILAALILVGVLFVLDGEPLAAAMEFLPAGFCGYQALRAHRVAKAAARALAGQGVRVPSVNEWIAVPIGAAVVGGGAAVVVAVMSRR